MCVVGVYVVRPLCVGYGGGREEEEDDDGGKRAAQRRLQDRQRGG